jgi:chromosome segregation ATPase
MPPKGMERPAAGPAGRRASKKAAIDPVAEKCGLVAEALLKANALPYSCRTFLAKGVQTYLAVNADDRHPFQAKVVEMVGTALHDMEVDLEKQLAQAETTVSSADEEKANRTNAVSSAEAKLSELEEKLKAAQETHDADKAAEAAAKSALEAASKAHAANEAESASLVDKKTRLDAAMKEKFEPLQASGKSGQEGRKTLNALVKVLKDLNFEGGLVESLSETLSKEPSARGTYDEIVLKHVSEHAAKLITDFEASAKKAEQTQAETAQAKESATTSHAAAWEKLSAPETGSKALLVAATQAKSDGKAAVASALAAVKTYEADMKEAARKLEDTKQAVAEFKEGPAKAFAELKELAPAPEPVEEPAPVEAEPAATEAVASELAAM